MEIFNCTNKKDNIIIFLNLLFIIIFITLQSAILFYYLDNLPNLIAIASFISLLAISIYNLTKTFELAFTKSSLESVKTYNDTLRRLHDDVSAFKHDFSNIITTIGGFVKVDDLDGLKKYYSQLESDCLKVSNLSTLSPDIVNNPGIYNLLAKKYHEAEEKGIQVNISFLLDLSTLHIKIYEFARILGILLDNAIDASEECDEKVINLIFKNDEHHSRQLIIIENTYKDKDLNTEMIFGKGISSKDNHTGLGLWEVRRIIGKNASVNLFTSKTEKYFSQQLEFYY